MGKRHERFGHHLATNVRLKSLELRGRQTIRYTRHPGHHTFRPRRQNRGHGPARRRTPEKTGRDLPITRKQNVPTFPFTEDGISGYSENAIFRFIIPLNYALAQTLKTKVYTQTKHFVGTGERVTTLQRPCRHQSVGHRHGYQML